jgi:hypothetical protein
MGGGGPPAGMMGGGGGPPAGMAGGRDGGRGPNSKAQLAVLIGKLDILTRKPLQVTLTDKQKTEVRKLIQELEAKKELGDDEAEAKLKDLREVLNEDQRKTLEVAGYRWPGQGGGRRTEPSTSAPNPFEEGENKEHLKSLRTQLEK